jgi:hypothetical protein
MKLPCVIYNQTHVLAEIRQSILTERKGCSPYLATISFTMVRLWIRRQNIEALLKPFHRCVS